MNNSTKKPFLLAGLVINIVAFSIYIIDCLIGIFALATALSEYANDPTFQTAAVIVLLSFILILAFSITGVVFSSVCIPRYKLEPEKFAKKKGMILTVFIFDIIVVVLSIIGFCTGSFSILGLFIVLALIVGAVFIMMDYSKNRKFIEQNQANNVQINETGNINTENKIEKDDKTTDTKENS